MIWRPPIVVEFFLFPLYIVLAMGLGHLASFYLSQTPSGLTYFVLMLTELFVRGSSSFFSSVALPLGPSHLCPNHVPRMGFLHLMPLLFFLWILIPLCSRIEQDVYHLHVTANWVLLVGEKFSVNTSWVHCFTFYIGGDLLWPPRTLYVHFMLPDKYSHYSWDLAPIFISWTDCVVLSPF